MWCWVLLERGRTEQYLSKFLFHLVGLSLQPRLQQSSKGSKIVFNQLCVTQKWLDSKKIMMQLNADFKVVKTDPPYVYINSQVAISSDLHLNYEIKVQILWLTVIIVSMEKCYKNPLRSQIHLLQWITVLFTSLYVFV